MTTETKSTTVEKIRLVGVDWPDVSIERSHYMIDETVPALVARTAEGEPLAAFSVYLWDFQPAEGCTWIKTWGEGEGALEELERLGLVIRTNRWAPAGYSQAAEVRLIGELA